MALTAWLRSLGFLAFALLSLTGTAQAQFPLALESKVVVAQSGVLPGGTITLTVISNGAINLSGIKKEQVVFFDIFRDVGVPVEIGTRNVDATARRLTVTAGDVNFTGLLGERQMHIVFGDVVVTFNFTVVAPPPLECPANCQPPSTCVDKKCVLLPTSCKPRCKPPMACNEVRKRCERRPQG